MKSDIYIWVILTFSLISYSFSGNSSGVLSTNCHQTFHFFFLSMGTPTFWIGEDISGECRISRLLNISINDSAVSLSVSDLKEYKNWGALKGLDSSFYKYEEQPLELIDKVWQFDNVKISTPPSDSTMMEEFREHIRHYGSNAHSWFKIKGKEGIIPAKIECVKTELLFSYETGLYINYEISEVHYFPGRYLLIFTNQPLKAVGSDTMHGFFIFKIKRET